MREGAGTWVRQGQGPGATRQDGDGVRLGSDPRSGPEETGLGLDSGRDRGAGARFMETRASMRANGGRRGLPGGLGNEPEGVQHLWFPGTDTPHPRCASLDRLPGSSQHARDLRSEGALSENTTWPRTSGLAAPQSQAERPPQRVPEAAVGEGELQAIRAPSNPGCCSNWQASGFRRVRGCGKVDDVRKGGLAGSRGSSGGVGVTS